MRDVANCEVDIFGTTLTLISTTASLASSTATRGARFSGEVATKAAEALAFLSDPIWPTGVWQIQKDDNKIDLLLRPDGFYTAPNTTPRVHRTLWGRYTLVGPKSTLSLRRRNAMRSTRPILAWKSTIHGRLLRWPVAIDRP